ncbi:hypothetical protein KDW_39230 [Dictyobacter vulcani]|uniref:ATPase AAA-type core domain-containing protein n=1 Tax=Dictyobacter vulcani TaxID=2607529 RepID=A0A5J4KTG7_9CHLR|nr:hypothetical protein [Dictyobacter vulcani]GER89761.1 hypothetical protein KDW_39230 [Dictyobacter vulcani]
MNRQDDEKEIVDRVYTVCNQQARYRVLWIVGEPRCGKTSLSKKLCQNNNWKYINFTLEPGYLDSLIGREEVYRPADFLEDLYRWCNEANSEYIFFDELVNAWLMVWGYRYEQAWLAGIRYTREFFLRVGRAPNLQAGVIFVTRARTADKLLEIFPQMNPNHIFELR